MLQIDTTAKLPYYAQIYEYYRREIETGHLSAGEQLLSVRELARRVGVSKMTVEQSYYQLASEGYIQSRNRARYQVTAITDWAAASPVDRLPDSDSAKVQTYRYHFASGEMDTEGFRFEKWRSYMNRVLQEPEQLLSYGDEQGEAELRQIISQHVYQTRGAQASADTIVIGAGTQPLLRIITSLLRGDHQSIGVENPGFRLGREVFRDEGYRIYPLSVQEGDIEMASLEKCGTRLVYVSPSHQFPTGRVMSINRRQELLRWAENTNGLIIEDDYDSELRYYGRPIPSLQGLDRAGRVVYMGSFSKVLPPSIRISYMILPVALLAVYNKKRELFRQNASLIEQKVLSEYIRAGELSKQIRRLRKIYQEKGRHFTALLSQYFGDSIQVERPISGVYCRVVIRSNDSIEVLVKKAKDHDCLVLPMTNLYTASKDASTKEFLLSFSRIPSQELEAAVATLHEAWR